MAAEFLHLGEPATDLDHVALDAFAKFADFLGVLREYSLPLFGGDSQFSGVSPPTCVVPEVGFVRAIARHDPESQDSLVSRRKLVGLRLRSMLSAAPRGAALARAAGVGNKMALKGTSAESRTRGLKRLLH